jgi:hypothetical protein
MDPGFPMGRAPLRADWRRMVLEDSSIFHFTITFL